MYAMVMDFRKNPDWTFIVIITAAVALYSLMVFLAVGLIAEIMTHL